MIDTSGTGQRRVHRGRRRWLLVALAVLAVAAAGAALVVLRDPSDPLSVDEAVTRYRGGGDGSGTSAGTGGAGGTALEPGVYVYATTGSEVVDALDGSEHTYPSRTSVTVTPLDGGCLSLRWDALVQRWSEQALCPERGGGWSLERATLFHSFFDQAETREYACAAAGFVPDPGSAAPGAETTWTCDSEGSGRSGESREEGRAEVLGVEPVAVAGVERDALRVRYTTTVSGETAGQATIDRWYALERPPLVLRERKTEATSSDTLIGTVNYQEDYEIVLEEWEPRQ